MNDIRHGFEIRFEPVAAGGRALAFPCDEHGNVELDALSAAERCDYLFARIMTRRCGVQPQVVPGGSRAARP